MNSLEFAAFLNLRSYKFEQITRDLIVGALPDLITLAAGKSAAPQGNVGGTRSGIKRMGESVEDNTPRVILDDAPGCQRVYRAPLAIIRADTVEDAVRALEDIERALKKGCHAAGYLSYELGYALEQRLIRLMPRERSMPLLWFGIFDSYATVRSEDGTNWPRTHAGPLAHGWDSNMHRAAFDHVHALISAGDLYQANVSYRAGFAFAGSPYAFYRQLKAQSAARHCAFVDDGVRQILSLSPELFFAIGTDGRVRVKPMKGTAARGQSAEADSLAIARLCASEKERAENLMIVDLLRNDLAKIAHAGSVRVEGLFEVETYPTLHQMVSTVSAQLTHRQTISNVIHALFPCGSVTGAPKLRAMEVIRDVETSPRGIYCGAIGRFSPDGTAYFNVAIRTLTIANGRGELGVGGAIVQDSAAAAEYDECRLKAQFFETVRKPVQLIETMRYSQAEGFVRGARHLARMERSADALGLSFDSERARAALDHVARGCRTDVRVRLLLDEAGQFHIETQPLPALLSFWRYAISPVRVHSADPLARHKTSRRRLYERARERLVAEAGCDEVVFLNENSELTEGSRSNIFIERDGRLLTPHIDCGLLDGCFRRELLDQCCCIEARLTCTDLENADRVFLGNSVRGLIPAMPI